MAAKLEEHQAKGWSIFNLLRVFHRINCRQMGKPLDLLQPHSQVRPALRRHAIGGPSAFFSGYLPRHC